MFERVLFLEFECQGKIILKRIGLLFFGFFVVYYLNLNIRAKKVANKRLKFFLQIDKGSIFLKTRVLPGGKKTKIIFTPHWMGKDLKKMY